MTNKEHIKDILLHLLLFFLLIPSCQSFAANRTITVQWSMPTDSINEIQDYVLNFSTNSDMSDAEVQACDQWQETGTAGDQTNFSMTCNNVPIVTGQTAYLTLEAVKTDGTKLTSSVFSKDTKISVVADFKILTPSANLPPTAGISASTTSGPAPLTVNFTSTSTDSDGTITAYEWNFGDNSPISTEANPIHTFSGPGTYQVALVVRDNDGAISNSATTTINVTENSEELVVSNVSPEYPISTYFIGSTVYIDRTYTILSLPEELTNTKIIKTANDDKYNTSSTFITFDINRNATLYIAYDSRASTYPTWLRENYTQTSYNITTTDYNGSLTYTIWSKNIRRGANSIPANKYGSPDGVGSMYLILLK